ncbi:MAG TPA: glycosyltransferase family 4 protein, partial [Thermomicrobiales bacterium]|nr:glycosyltransferase family 4 protein [Thermomicrobiales bacterium]
IHAHLHEGALIGGVIGRALRKPVLFDYQGSLTEEMLDHHFIPAGGLRERVMRRIERVIDRLPQVIVPSGSAAEEYLRERGDGPRRVRLIADAVDPERFDPELVRDAGAVVRRRLGIPATAPVVVYLGLLAEYQGTPLLLEAASLLLARNPELYVIVAGYPGADAYAALAEQLGIADRVLFPGRIPYDDAPALLAAGDVAVAPKHSMTEGNGKLFNYMAMELPTVAIDTGPNRQVLGDLGHLVPAGDPTALARGILDALEDTQERRAALRARAAERFSWHSQVRLIEAVYAKALGLADAEIDGIASNGRHAAVVPDAPSDPEARVERDEILFGGRRND